VRHINEADHDGTGFSGGRSGIECEKAFDRRHESGGRVVAALSLVSGVRTAMDSIHSPNVLTREL
jgi:hypothetical protein